ncbi:hypothetical protein GCM10020358_31470 [Amorphoplanes nipponensis]|uniref:Uncharacterized protein n=1 Tax=Actinoplanes nipponensis TaxID=135950 RepID=A0A919JJW9_9ACTN|nr:hypothetical protein Ani05nite_43410 [Actinoplanes nipponensis]
MTDHAAGKPGDAAAVGPRTGAGRRAYPTPRRPRTTIGRSPRRIPDRQLRGIGSAARSALPAGSSAEPSPPPGKGGLWGEVR